MIFNWHWSAAASVKRFSNLSGGRMEKAAIDVAPVLEQPVVTLGELQLALVGGGIGETVL